MSTTTKTAVIYRKFKKGGDVIALFPELRADNHAAHCLSYQHIGQHGAADPAGVIADSVPATDAETAALHAELTRAGYDLLPMKKYTRLMFERRNGGAK